VLRKLWKNHWWIGWFLMWPFGYVTTWAIIFALNLPELQSWERKLLRIGGAVLLDGLLCWDGFRRHGWSTFYPGWKGRKEDSTQDKTSMLDNDQATKAAALSDIAFNATDPEVRLHAALALSALRRKIMLAKDARSKVEYTSAMPPRSKPLAGLHSSQGLSPPTPPAPGAQVTHCLSATA
jgi:hypothetical protein